MIKPLGNRVLVERVEAETKTAGGLFLPDSAKEKPSKGEVVACGPGKMTADGNRVAMDVKPGDVVLFAKFAGTEIKLDGEEYKIVRQSDILAIVE